MQLLHDTIIVEGDYMEQHKILREIMRNLERKMGMLDEFQVDCQNITCAQCHALVEIGRAKTLSLIHLSVIYI